jgi:large conductance mechanosensitive channel
MWRDLRSVVGDRTAVQLMASIAVAVGVFQLIHALVSGFLISPLSFIGFNSGSESSPPLTFEIDGKYFYYADILGYAVTLVLVTLVLALVVWFVRPRLWDEVEMRDCPLCLSEIPLAATVCGACGREVAA